MSTYPCTIINPTTRETRRGYLTTEHSASSYGAPVVVIEGQPVDAGKDGFTGLGVDFPLIRDETTATSRTDPEEYRIGALIFKQAGAVDNEHRWDAYTYSGEVA